MTTSTTTLTGPQAMQAVRDSTPIPVVAAITWTPLGEAGASTLAMPRSS